MERGGGAATASAAGAKVFGGSRLKTLFGISKGGGAGHLSFYLSVCMSVRQMSVWLCVYY